MKKLLWLLFGVVLLLVALPGALGFLAKKEIESQLELVEDNPLVRVRIKEFDRGWFGSDVDYEIGLTDEYLEVISQAARNDGDADAGSADSADVSEIDQLMLDAMAAFELTSRITHGPVGLADGIFVGLFHSDTRNGTGNSRLNEFLQLAGMPYLFRATGVTGFSGNSDFAVAMPAGQIAEGSVPAESAIRQFEFSGLTAAGVHNGATNRVTMTGEAQLLQMRTQRANLELAGLELSSDITPITETLMLGPAEISLASVKMVDYSGQQDDGGGEVVMSGLEVVMDTTSDVDEGTADVSVIYRIAAMDAGDEQVSDLEIALQLGSLSLDGMASYAKWNEEVLRAAANSAEPSLDALEPMLHAFAVKSPTLSINPITFTADDETFLGSLTLAVDGTQVPDIDAFDMMDIPLWLGAASGEAALAISEGLAIGLATSSVKGQLATVMADQQGITDEQLDQMAAAQAPLYLDGMVQQGMLKKKAGKISAAVSYANGALLLNGQPMPLEALLGGQ